MTNSPTDASWQDTPLSMKERAGIRLCTALRADGAVAMRRHLSTRFAFRL
jgi:hypothetical protein